MKNKWIYHLISEKGENMYRQSNAHKCLPYSHQRVKQILRDYYHYRLKPVGGYKANRRYGYVQKYHVIDTDTGETILEWVTLNAIRIVLTEEGFPLFETMKPCKGAMEFLEYIETTKNK